MQSGVLIVSPWDKWRHLQQCAILIAFSSTENKFAESADLRCLLVESMHYGTEPIGLYGVAETLGLRLRTSNF